MSSTATGSNTIGSALAAEMEQEAKTTRTCLERVPADKFGWKPHEKSMEMGRLASHISEMFGWTKATLENDVLNFATMDYKPFEPKSTEDLVEHLNKNVSESLEALRGASDDAFMRDWTMRNGE